MLVSDYYQLECEIRQLKENCLGHCKDLIHNLEQKLKQLKDSSDALVNQLDLRNQSIDNLKEETEILGKRYVKYFNLYSKTYHENKELLKELEWTKKEWNNSNPSKECREENKQLISDNQGLKYERVDLLTNIKKLKEILKEKVK